MAWFDDLDLPGSTVTGHFGFVHEDGPDEDTNPDIRLASGRVTFTPTATAVRAEGAWIGIAPIEAVIFEGSIVNSEEAPTPPRILSTDADTGVEDWAWRASFEIPGVTFQPFTFKAPTTGVHLTSGLIPIKSVPYQVIEGRQGIQGASVVDVEQETPDAMQVRIEDPATGEEKTSIIGLPRGPEGPYGGTEVTDPQVASYLSPIVETATKTAAVELINDSQVTGFELVRERAEMFPDRVLLGLVNGVLYGAVGRQISRLVNGAWVNVTELPAGPLPKRLYALADGEVLVNRDRSLWRSQGWADPATASFTEVVAVPNPDETRFQEGWGVSVEGHRILATEYGTHGISRYGWYSDDNGATFTRVFDLHDFPGGTTSGIGGAHMHGAGINPYDGTLFLVAGDAAASAIYWAEWSAPTVWRPIPHHPVATQGFKVNPTTITATRWGMVLGSDGDPNGVWHIAHSVSRNYRVEFPLIRRYGRPSTQVVGRHIHVDSKHVAWNLLATTDPASHPSFIAAGGSPETQSVVWEDTDRQIGYPNGVFPHGNYLYIGTNTGHARVRRPKSGLPAPEAIDSGWVLGGSADFGQQAVAVGLGSRAGHRAVGVGSGASASEPGSVALGYLTRAEKTGAIAIGGSNGAAGSEAAATADNAIAIGAYSRSTSGIAIGSTAECHSVTSTVLGVGATSPAGNSSNVVLGYGATGVGSSSVALGRQAASAASSVAIGMGSTTGTSGVAVGLNAKTVANNGVAVGREAVAGHLASVAMGHQTQSTASNQVAVGQRHIEIGSRVAPGAPAVGNARLYVTDSGGKQGLWAVFPSGHRQQIAVEP